MHVPVYMIVKRTGQLDGDGRECCIVFDIKLTRAAADVIAKFNPGTEVIKMVADKEVPET